MTADNCDGAFNHRDHAIVAGFGVPGRVAADSLLAKQMPFCVIELNRATVERCATTKYHVIEGDVCDEQTLRRAGVETASLLVLAVPSDPAVLEAITVARRLNPRIRILARCRFISSGMEAHRRGANQVIIEEQVVAQELQRTIESSLQSHPAPAEPIAQR
jgi:CPA2 family monovalent cation:H+ antiporter-2